MVFAVVVAATLVCGATLGPAAIADGSTPPARCAVSRDLVPSCGVLLGAATHKVGTQTWDQSVATHEKLIGRKVDVLHNYHQWDTAFPTAAEAARAASGQKLLFSWIGTRQNGTTVKWAGIAAGAEDKVIDAEAMRIAALRVPVFLNFQNEPESHITTSGTAAEYVAAWRHIHRRFARAHVTNVVWTVVFMGVTSDRKIAQVRALYPGQAYVDWIAWDPYNRGVPWRSFSGTVRPFYSWLMDNGYGGKPFMLAEYGTIENPADPKAKADWFTGAAASLADGEFPNLKVVSYFDHPAPPAGGNWIIATSRASLGSYAALGRALAKSSTTPVTTPGAPSTVVAVAGSSSATVSWTAPRSTGAGVINAYRVTATPGGNTVTVAGPLPASQAAMAGLTPGTPYTFTVAAINSAGTGVRSHASPPVRPRRGTMKIPTLAAGWRLNGAAVALSGGRLQLTDAVTKFSKGSAFWPAPISAASVAVSFNAVSSGGAGGADGLTLAFADAGAGARATSLGSSGGGLGWSGIPGFAVAVDTYANGTDPSDNFVGLATGFHPASVQDLVWRATSTAVPSLRAVRHFCVVVSGGRLFVSVDGTQVLRSAVRLPATTLVGFTASDGNRTDRHAVSNLVISAGP